MGVKDWGSNAALWLWGTTVLEIKNTMVMAVFIFLKHNGLWKIGRFKLLLQKGINTLHQFLCTGNAARVHVMRTVVIMHVNCKGLLYYMLFFCLMIFFHSFIHLFIYYNFGKNQIFLFYHYAENTHWYQKKNYILFQNLILTTYLNIEPRCVLGSISQIQGFAKIIQHACSSLKFYSCWRPWKRCWEG